MTSLWHTLVPKPNQSKRVITKFADSFGLVYFGYVSQRDDEHHIVRGMTVSTKHKDDHYCIGTHDGYDVIFVERSDELKDGKKHSWHILEIDMKTDGMPHAFIGSDVRTHGFHELLALKYRSLSESTLGHTATYPSEFNTHFNVHVAADNQIQLERLITPDIADVLASHFKGLVIEVHDDMLYVYSEQSSISLTLLETMLKNGVWLAGLLDTKNRES